MDAHRADRPAAGRLAKVLAIGAGLVLLVPLAACDTEVLLLPAPIATDFYPGEYIVYDQPAYYEYVYYYDDYYFDGYYYDDYYYDDYYYDDYYWYDEYGYDDGYYF